METVVQEKVKAKAGEIMNYDKPRIVIHASNLAIVQGGRKALAFVWDCFLVISTGAYEADE
jgi:hypothetical protein